MDGCCYKITRFNTIIRVLLCKFFALKNSSLRYFNSNNMKLNQFMFSLFSLFSISVLLLNVYNQDISKYSVSIFSGIPSKYNIFMVETNTESDYLNFNQLCSIESNALHNPQATLNLLSLRAKINQTILFEKYPNIKWSLMSVEDIFEDTCGKKVN